MPGYEQLQRIHAEIAHTDQILRDGLCTSVKITIAADTGQVLEVRLTAKTSEPSDHGHSFAGRNQLTMLTGAL